MRKNRRNVIINNYNNDIDYDKLAQAIIKTQNQHIEGEDIPEEKVGFLKGIWLILSNKKDTNGVFTMSLFSMFTSLLFKVIAIIGFVLGPAIIVVTICSTVESIKAGNNIFFTILTAIAFIAVSIFMIVFMVIVWGASNEIDKEKDRNYVISVFSGIVSLVALIVAIIALLKGVAV